MIQITYRDATPDDTAAMLAIYRPIVENTVISFELETPSEEEFAGRVAAYGASHAWLVAEANGVLAGYAYGSPHRPRAAYRYAVEVSAYVDERFRGRGIASSLYGQLFERLRGQGYASAYAGITLPNDASIALHSGVGFNPIGTFPKVGFKFDRWHDVSWWYRPV